MKERIVRILLSAIVLLLVVTALPKAPALQLDKDFNGYNIYFKYPKEVNFSVDEGTDEFGILLGRHVAHFLFVAWVTSPVDPKDVSPYIANATSTIIRLFGAGNLSLSFIPGSEGQADVERHTATYRRLTGMFGTWEVGGAAGSWYCDVTHRVFTLASFDMTQGFKLFTQYLSNFNCHPTTPGFPLEGAAAGLGLGFTAILLQRRRRTTARRVGGGET
jgi:hypothetical protein